VELRHDPVTGRAVIVAPERDARPRASRTLTEAGPAPADCPFCPGNEHLTPPEVHRTGAGAADGPGWRVRVVPNLFPIVGGPHATSETAGAHEVIALSPGHDRSFGGLDDDQATEVLTVLRTRALEHRRDGFRFVQVLVNHGREAGASLPHPHAQLVALGFVPPAALAARDRFAAAGMDLVARERDEVRAGPFGVQEGPVPVWCPPASGTPYEMRMRHEAASPRFEDATDGELRDAGPALRDALARLARTAGDVPYNVVVHSPADPAGPGAWYVAILPRTSVVAGFEIGTGLCVNVVAPEAAAARLRDAE
jgi:UDPglucose--hexose-1-phosphate uridylyltransferase